MNLIPKTIQEAVFMKVANSGTGNGPENLWEGEQINSRGFDAKGRFTEKGLLEIEEDCKVLVPFTRTYEFGKPRRAPKPKPDAVAKAK